MTEKAKLLQQTIQHYDMKTQSVVGVVDAMNAMAFQARNLANAAQLYEKMLRDRDCAVILCLAGSLFSAGLKQIVVDMIENRMVDAIVSTGANIVDQDFFEGLGFQHYVGDTRADDNQLRELGIDRIYDTYIDEDELRICDMTIKTIADGMPAKPTSSREFIREMGAYLEQHGKNPNSVVLAAYKHGVPIFVPAFSDCSAGFGLVCHQVERPDNHLSLDSAKDFRELTMLKLENPETGLLMIGGGVPKNFAQDVVVAADLLGESVPMHKYAIQVTVADERDGALSGSTLREACSWGKVDLTNEQMVWAEATLALPLIAGYAYEKKAWEARPARNFAGKLDRQPVASSK